MPYSHEVMLSVIKDGQDIVSKWSTGMKLDLSMSGKSEREIKVKRDTVESLSEFFDVSLKYVKKMSDLHQMLEHFQDTPEFKNMNSEQSLTYNHYLGDVEQVLVVFDALRLVEAISSLDASPALVLSSLNDKITGVMFNQFTEAAKKLVFSQKAMTELYSEHQGDLDPYFKRLSQDMGLPLFMNIASYFLETIQYVLRLSILVKAISESFEKEKKLGFADPEALTLAFAQQLSCVTTTLAQTTNEEMRMREVLDKGLLDIDIRIGHERSPSKRQVMVCKAILSLNMNMTPQLDLVNRVEADYFDIYLKKSLALAYPEQFEFEAGCFTFNTTGELVQERQPDRYVDIVKALGIDCGADQWTFDAKRFDVETLDGLFLNDGNPLWLVLKSTIPVGDEFTSTQKIQAYIDVAEQYAHKKIGKTDKYLGAYEMAKAAYAVAAEFPTEENINLAKAAFEPHRLMVGNTSKEQQDRNLGDWIRSKIIKYEKQASKRAIVDLTALDAPGLRGVRSSEASTLEEIKARDSGLDSLTNASTSDSSLEDDNQSQLSVMTYLSDNEDQGLEEALMHTFPLIVPRETITTHSPYGAGFFKTIDTKGVASDALMNKILVDFRLSLEQFDRINDIDEAVQAFKQSHEYKQLSNSDKAIDEIVLEAKDRVERLTLDSSSC